MSLEICVLLVLPASVLLNVYLIFRVNKTLKATETLGLKKTIQHELFEAARHCHETTELYYPGGRDQAESKKNMPGYIVRRLEKEFEEEAKMARTIGYPCSLDWRDTFQQFHHTPREPGHCSDPTHQM